MRIFIAGFFILCFVNILKAMVAVFSMKVSVFASLLRFAFLLFVAVIRIIKALHTHTQTVSYINSINCGWV